MYKYAIELFYSKEDQGYIATVPELPGCSAFGETEEEALMEVKDAMGLWLKTAKKEGRKIPQPLEKELLKLLIKNTEPQLILKETKGKYQVSKNIHK